MQLKDIAQLTFVGIGILSLTGIGCTQPRNFEADSQAQIYTISNPSTDQAQATSTSTTEAPTRSPSVVSPGH